jgi:hypothetical protein
MHAVVHALVETQLALNEPVSVREACARLMDEVLDRHEATHAFWHYPARWGAALRAAVALNIGSTAPFGHSIPGCGDEALPQGPRCAPRAQHSLEGVLTALSRVSSSVPSPTKAGTGSEVGGCSVLTDVRDHTKKVIFHPRLLRAIVILDPELHLACRLPSPPRSGWMRCRATSRHSARRLELVAGVSVVAGNVLVYALILWLGYM